METLDTFVKMEPEARSAESPLVKPLKENPSRKRRTSRKTFYLKTSREDLRLASTAELEVAEELLTDGWEIYKNGWPDFLAVRGDEVRFIEVKRDSQQPVGKPRQRAMHKVLEKCFEVRVEIIRPRDL